MYFSQSLPIAPTESKSTLYLLCTTPFSCYFYHSSINYYRFVYCNSVVTYCTDWDSINYYRNELEPLFDTNLDIPPLANADVPATNVPDQLATFDFIVDPAIDQVVDHIDRRVNIPEPCWSARAPHPSQARLQSTEYQRRETAGKDEGQEWANDSRHPQP